MKTKSVNISLIFFIGYYVQKGEDVVEKTKNLKYPLITKQRMFYETMQEILPDLEVIIDNGDGSVQKILPLDTFGE